MLHTLSFDANEDEHTYRLRGIGNGHLVVVAEGEYTEREVFQEGVLGFAFYYDINDEGDVMRYETRIQDDLLHVISRLNQQIRHTSVYELTPGLLQALREWILAQNGENMEEFHYEPENVNMNNANNIVALNGGRRRTRRARTYRAKRIARRT